MSRASEGARARNKDRQTEEGESEAEGVNEWRRGRKERSTLLDMQFTPPLPLKASEAYIVNLKELVRAARKYILREKSRPKF